MWPKPLHNQPNYKACFEIGHEATKYQFSTNVWVARLRITLHTDTKELLTVFCVMLGNLAKLQHNRGSRFSGSCRYNTNTLSGM